MEMCKAKLCLFKDNQPDLLFKVKQTYQLSFVGY